MIARLGRRRLRQKRKGYGKAFRFVWVRFQLPASVVEARGGLIPSDETDGMPPPIGLTVTELLAWYTGLPVWCKKRAKRL
jgi:hypothetical protein